MIFVNLVNKRESSTRSEAGAGAASEAEEKRRTAEERCWRNGPFPDVRWATCVHWRRKGRKHAGAFCLVVRVREDGESFVPYSCAKEVDGELFLRDTRDRFPRM